jgi:hypothetical protein
MNWVDELLQVKTVKALPIMTHPGIEKIGKTVRDAVTVAECITKPFAIYRTIIPLWLARSLWI